MFHFTPEHILWVLNGVFCFYTKHTYLVGTQWECFVFTPNKICGYSVEVFCFYTKHILWVLNGGTLFLHQNISCGCLVEAHYFCTKTYLVCTQWKCLIFAPKNILWVFNGNVLYLHQKHILWFLNGGMLFLHQTISSEYSMEAL